MKSKLKELKDYLKENYNDWQVFICESQFDTIDQTEEVYNKNDIQVYECSHYGYIDIVGITLTEATAIGLSYGKDINL